MKTFVIVVETAIISFFAGALVHAYGERVELKEKEAAEQAAKENPEA
jgi:hypothetical protein